jgi:hypothetical protein
MNQKQILDLVRKFLQWFIDLIGRLLRITDNKKATSAIIINSKQINKLNPERKHVMTLNCKKNKNLLVTARCIDEAGGAAIAEDLIEFEFDTNYFSRISEQSRSEYTDENGEPGTELVWLLETAETTVLGITNVIANYDGRVGEQVLPFQIEFQVDISDLDAIGANLSAVEVPKQ